MARILAIKADSDGYSFWVKIDRDDFEGQQQELCLYTREEITEMLRKERLKCSRTMEAFAHNPHLFEGL